MNFAVIGHPIAHSFSPFLHQVNFTENNDGHRYSAIDVEPIDIKNIRGITRIHDLSGFNVTVPHKETIIPYLDYISDSARVIGAVNTVKIVDGKYTGYNTDVTGYKQSYSDAFGEDFKKVLILGAGGASKAVLSAHLSFGHDVTIAARRMESFKSFENKNFKIHIFGSEYESKFDVIVNATPLGLNGEDAFKSFNLEQVVHDDTIGMDLIYNSEITPFMSHFENNKNGLDMLIGQAMDAYEIWTDKKGNREVVRAAFIERENL
ncbi:shikimate dehydrogenase family protein [Phocicoccus pinnipedialis]|uniref:Shikimate dehydrogenase n=1 Tax=Phocicoccus pinnipedialis TaxID=110845 RepID=A0A6V7REJ7_9BACL|nr:shikimate dehydrogenase [Jeotgalicoccus pinnipedialis]MBP1939237.1 shikimate dehydrogenase [Jeotgalicoccus pinnipedialis]CAD2076186.1 Shikimate dehydrogenase [Jeotgalicoccus pinnipedialis]